MTDTYYLNEIADEIRLGDDRTAVIVGAAKLEFVLGQALERFLSPSPTGRDELLDGDRPLSTFSARIEACHRLCLIPPDMARALHLIRRIRNEFAHHSGRMTLEIGSNRDRIRQLDLAMTATTIYEDVMEIFKEQEPSSQRFRTAVTVLILAIDVLIDKLESVRPNTTAFLAKATQ